MNKKIDNVLINVAISEQMNKLLKYKYSKEKIYMAVSMLSNEERFILFEKLHSQTVLNEFTAKKLNESLVSLAENTIVSNKKAVRK